MRKRMSSKFNGMVAVTAESKENQAPDPAALPNAIRGPPSMRSKSLSTESASAGGPPTNCVIALTNFNSLNWPERYQKTTI